MEVVEKELGVRVTVHGITWHYSHPLERSLDIELPALADMEKVKEVIVKAMRVVMGDKRQSFGELRGRGHSRPRRRKKRI